MITMSNGKPDKRIPGTLTYNCDQADMELLEALATHSRTSKTAVIRNAVRVMARIKDKRVLVEDDGKLVELVILD